MTSDTHYEDKVLRRLARIPPDQLQAFILGLVRERDFFRSALMAIGEALLLIDNQGRLLLANEAGKALLTPRARLALAQEASRALVEFRADELGEVLVTHLADPEPILRREVPIRRPNKRVLVVSALPIEPETPDAAPTIWVWSIGDVTDAYRRIGERRQSQNLNSLATLTAGVAHEVRNPLNSLNIHAQLIDKAAAQFSAGAVPEAGDLERLRRSTGVILEETQRLARIVDQFIQSVRPTEPKLRKVDLNELIVSVAELIGPTAAQTGIELSVDLDPEMPPLLLDPDQMRQALLNLAKNAVEAIDPKRMAAPGPGHVTLRSTLKTDHALVEVEDNGVGIAESERSRIFEPYHTTKASGTGLGLMVVFRIVQAHQGAIGLISAPGRGSCFQIALPLDERPVRLLASEVHQPPSNETGRLTEESANDTGTVTSTTMLEE